MKTRQDIKKETRQFFKSLIDVSGDYFLSDYVDCYSEFNPNIISKSFHKEIVKRRNELKKQCQEFNIDMHLISCKVADDFLTNKL
jgi:peroxiredoxin family protein